MPAPDNLGEQFRDRKRRRGHITPEEITSSWPSYGYSGISHGDDQGDDAGDDGGDDG